MLNWFGSRVLKICLIVLSSHVNYGNAVSNLEIRIRVIGKGLSGATPGSPGIFRGTGNPRSLLPESKDRFVERPSMICRTATSLIWVWLGLVNW